MNSRDIILANLDWQNPPRPGMNFDRGRLDDLMIVGLDTQRVIEARRWVEGNKEFYTDEWQNVWVRMVGGCEKGEIHTPSLTSWDQLDSLNVPDYSDQRFYATMRRQFAQPTDKFKVAHIGGWIFDNARYIRKMENYFMDMVAYPDELNRLHHLIGEVYSDRIHGAGKAGADAIFIGEDMGTQNGLLFSPAMFRQFFKELYTSLISLAHEYGMKVLLHSCGKNWEIIDDLLEIGIDCFQFDQPALYDMSALAAKLKQRKAALWSPVDIQKVLPTGDQSFIRKQTQLMIETFQGGLIVKNYPDLHGIGVKEEWDMWAYDTVMCHSNLVCNKE